MTIKAEAVQRIHQLGIYELIAVLAARKEATLPIYNDEYIGDAYIVSKLTEWIFNLSFDDETDDLFVQCAPKAYEAVEQLNLQGIQLTSNHMMRAQAYHITLIVTLINTFPVRHGYSSRIIGLAGMSRLLESLSN